MKEAHSDSEISRDFGRANSKKAIALLMVASVFVGTKIVSAQARLRANAGISYEQKKENPLKSISELPGYNMHVSPELRDKLKDSTVVILRRGKENHGDAPNSWHYNCSGVKISARGKTYIMSAAHCHSQTLNNQLGVINNSGSVYTAENIIDKDPYDYTVIDPKETKLPEAGSPLTIDGIAVSTENTDVVLLRPTSNVQSGIGASQEQPFDEIPSIGLNLAIKPATPGQQVFLYGMPQLADFRPRPAIGRYLGRIKRKETDSVTGKVITRELDWVAINPSHNSNNICEPGYSGSSAVLSDGRRLGPLSIRSNNNSRGFTLSLQEDLDIKLAGKILCGYTVTSKNTVNHLVEGFDNPAVDIS